ncbi:hypothetical protein CVD25_19995 [Bacillus canaveralius]|uniref:YwdI family protein n=1 Tax=Bacillus canaveralius TaxID=1403243 RepID=A0A2N5GJU7_9BACI|nr:YwdI family protein [Bacillus canaveralius]PLR81579.1 hypothetical protein CU635_14610 [Bacillus canaveralius]PLR90881.1 hypothetical protein CVD25_19995 [Bacillus canaveralius]
MNDISIQKLIGKIEEELVLAKREGADARVRERIYAIKALCEIILDDDHAPKRHHRQEPADNRRDVQPMPMAIQQTKKIAMEDGSNGDSLFDF